MATERVEIYPENFTQILVIVNLILRDLKNIKLHLEKYLITEEKTYENWK